METKAKLSQWDALMLEGLRGLGWTDEEIVRRIRERDGLPADDSIYEFDYAQLADFAAANPETFERAVREGYAIKYNTVRGIRSWINVAFAQEPELVLEAGNESVVAKLTPAERERLLSVLSYGWAVREERPGEAGTYRIEPIQR
ncbi:hypothetical protein I8J29_15685 [Paenibacillus sp. MWE-103]|uniref:Uncharacterized protein n=1 Tax=Paenibacillus artemisiicola TaxID=1172618 RepID=A0ABS3WBF5_9BACL|nr:MULTISPECIES: hypothetical protein [Paenibacillus]MBO7745652.1 hypothetical protein [Paenibacillus artemisiicola]SFI76282.1 hypothetical protein SAMN02799624_02067 [Paenibacillus sp. UNC496MF]